MKYSILLCICILCLTHSAGVELSAADPAAPVELKPMEFIHEDGSSYMSFDGGRTWSVLDLSDNVNPWPIASPAPVSAPIRKHLDDGSVVASFNRGLTWHVVTENEQVSPAAALISVVETDNSGVTVRPNPASSRISIAYRIDNKSTVVILIRDMYGRIVKQIEKPGMRPGRQYESVAVTDLRAGVYNVHIQTDGRVQMAQFVVAR